MRELQLIATVATMANLLIVSNTKHRNNKIINIPSGGTITERSGGSMCTSQHSMLLEVADQSQIQEGVYSVVPRTSTGKEDADDQRTVMLDAPPKT